MSLGKRPPGLQAIIVYKFAKAIFSASIGAIALVLLHTGTEAAAATLAQKILDHATREWALKVATLIVRVGTRRHVIIAAVGGFADSAVSLLEGVSLRSGAWWGPWLVVAATGALLPWELAVLVRRPDWVRVVVFLINLAVVVYLLVQARRELFERRAPTSSPPSARWPRRSARCRPHRAQPHRLRPGRRASQQSQWLRGT